MEFTGERFIPGAADVEPTFQRKMYQEHLNRYAFARQFVAGRRVLDVACGVGYGAPVLLEGKPASITGLDISGEAIEFARTNFELPGVQFEQGDAQKLPFGDGAFDLVVSFETIEHLPSPVLFLNEVRRTLVADGIFVVSTPRRTEKRRSRFHVNELDFEGFRQLLVAYFSAVIMYGQNNHVASTIHQEGNRLEEADFIDLHHLSAPTSDYFVAVCGPEGLSVRPRSTIVLNSDAYLMRLETDVGILHAAEDRLKHEIEVIEERAKVAEEQIQALATRTSAAEFDAEELRQRLLEMEAVAAARSGSIDVLEADLGRARSNIDVLEAELGRARSQVDETNTTCDSLRQRLTVTVGQVKSLEADNADARRLVGAHESTLRSREALCDALTRDVESYRRLLGRWPLRPVSVYYTHGRKVFLKQVVLKMLVLLRLAPYTPPGVPSVLDKALSAYRSSGLRGLVRRMKPPPERVEPSYPSRRRRPDVLAQNGVANGRATVCYVVGTREGESKRYRAFDMLEYLACEGIAAFACDPSALDQDPTLLDGCSVLVLMRLGYDDRAGRIIDAAHARHIPVAFEVDDLVFDPTIMDQVDGIRGWPPDAQRDYYLSLVRYRRTLQACDFAICTTDFLARSIRQVGVEAFVVPNGLSPSHVATAEEARRKRKPHMTGVSIGYFSGTSTHDADFRVAAPALVRILRDFPNVSLEVVGPLNLPQEMTPFQERIRQRDLVRWEELPDLIASVDVNIAPLEVGNPFCEAKSPLKFVDAAIVGVPTIASATEAFELAISHGKTGFVCRTSEDWYHALRSVVERPDVRTAIGNEAVSSVEVAYGPRQMGELTSGVIGAIMDRWMKQREVVAEQSSAAHALEASCTARRLHIGWIVPPPFTGSGGHRNIFRAVRYLSRFGHEVSVYVPTCVEFRSAKELSEFVDREFGVTNARFEVGTDVAPCDGLFATHWSTVGPVLANRERARRLLYFVQDFEPYFYPMSYEYILAEQTYTKGLAMITSGPLCKKIIEDRYGGRADFFRFPVDRLTYRVREDLRDTSGKTVAFFARPEMPRRLFPLGVAALEILARRQPDVEIVLFGSEAVKSMNFAFRCTTLGNVRDIRELAHLYGRATVGVAFSTTNPSLVPYEMMACGAAVVDVDYGYNSVNYGSGDGVCLVEPTPEAVAGGIERLCTDHELRQRITRAALTLVDEFPDEEGMARAVEAFVIRECAG